MKLIRVGGAAAVCASIVASAWLLSDSTKEGRALAFSLASGALFGAVLQRSRFCFQCHTRDFLEDGDARGILAILVALAIGTLGYHVVLGSWLPDPTTGRIAPDAHIGPVGGVLVLAAFVFGVGMAVSGACISGHLYRLGEGSPTAVFAILGVLAGFVAGFATWNSLYLVSIHQAPAVWLPAYVGYGPWLTIQLAVIAGLAALVLLRHGPEARWHQANARSGESALAAAVRALFVDRWSAVVGGAAVGVIATASYLRVAPLGVTAELGSLARTVASSAGLLPEALHGLDALAGCRTAVRTAILSNNGVFVLGLVSASFASALGADQFRPERPRIGHALRGLTGGFLLGWGAMTAIGCTVGTLLSGIMAGAVSGWVFLFACFLGIAATSAATRAIRAA